MSVALGHQNPMQKIRSFEQTHADRSDRLEWDLNKKIQGMGPRKCLSRNVLDWILNGQGTR